MKFNPRLSPEINICNIFEQVLVHLVVNYGIIWRFYRFLQYLYPVERSTELYRSSRHFPWVHVTAGTILICIKLQVRLYFLKA